MDRMLCQAVGAGPTFFSGCMRVAARCRREGFVRCAPCSVVRLLTPEDELAGSGERINRVESKSDSEVPGSATGVNDRGVSMSF